MSSFVISAAMSERNFIPCDEFGKHMSRLNVGLPNIFNDERYSLLIQDVYVKPYSHQKFGDINIYCPNML
jgi:hypothetical protein